MYYLQEQDKNKFDNIDFKCIDVFDQVSNVMLYDINGNIVIHSHSVMMSL